MKKTFIFILVIGFLLILPAGAQIKLGIKGGVNISKVYLNEDVFDDSNITGFQIGPVLSVLHDSPLNLEVGALFSQRGLETKVNGRTFETRTNYIDVPVHLKFKFGVPVLRFYCLGGPYISFKVSGDDSINGAYESISNQWKAKSFEAGLQAGAGIELLNFIQLGANYEWGLTDNYSTKDFDAKNRTLSIYTIVYF